jgi:hypothetical protein
VTIAAILLVYAAVVGTAGSRLLGRLRWAHRLSLGAGAAALALTPVLLALIPAIVALALGRVPAALGPAA